MSMILILAAAPFLQGFQDSDFSDLRFHRVHLRNGNFIDGHVIKNSTGEVVLRLKGGEMGIKRDQIESVEVITMKSNDAIRKFLEGPKKETKQPPKSPTTEPIKNPTAEATPGEIKKRIEVMVWKVKTMSGDEKEFPLQELAALGEEGLVYLLSKTPEFDLVLLDATAAAVIAIKPTAKIAAAIEGLLTSDNSKVRAMAVNILGVTQAPDDKLKLLRPALQDSDARVRVTALSALGSSEDRELFGAMSDLCADLDRDVRGRAMRIAKNIATKHGFSEQFVRTLVGNLGHNNEGVRADSAAVIGTMGVPDAWTHLAPVLNDPEPTVRAVTAQALMGLGAPESAETVYNAMLREQDKWARIGLAGAAEKLKITKACEPLIDWLADSDPDLKRVAQTALTLLSGETFGPDREKWVAWWEKNRPK